jgi:hypothetical protein
MLGVISRMFSSPLSFIRHPSQPIVAKQPHMNFLSRYIRYLKDNPGQYWFKRRAYGWGWVPATLQGWLTLVVFLVIFLWLFVPFVNGPEPTGTDTFWFLTKMLVWAAALIGVSYLTGEPPKWQWGIPEDSDKREKGFDSQLISQLQ